MATNVPGLDLVLNGGLEPGSVVMVAGPPGVGKTILAQQICFASATAERRCVYYTTMSEPHTKLVRHLEQFAFFDLASLSARVEHIHLGDFLRPARPEGLEPMVSEIVRKTLEDEPAVVVIDSVKMLRDFTDERGLRAALFDLTGLFSHTDTLLLLLGEYTRAELDSDLAFSMADGIIQLEYEPREPVDRRWLRVSKMRGGSHRPGKHTFRIDSGGIEVFPRIETLIPVRGAPGSRRVPGGIPGLDDLMTGGTRVGDATLLMGPSGVGKTIFGLRWVAQELEQGQRCVYVSFQDTAAQLVGMANAFGWNLEACHASGQLVILHVPTGELDLDILASAIRVELAEQPVSRVVIDSLAELALAAREWERFPAFVRSLVGLVRSAGSSSLFTSETIANAITAPSLDGLMFLFDNVIDLRYIEQESRMGRSINIVKMRNSPHAMTLNGYTITDQGIVVGGKLKGVTGRLGWSALRMPDSPEPVAPAVPAPAIPAPAKAPRARLP